jgi:exodeoxyribonuclease V beta subunit
LEAVLEPRRDILLRTALSTGLFGLNAADIVAFDSAEDKWQAWLDKFLDYRSKWENACFIALFRHLLVDQNVRERLVRCPAGERVLTNFLHIAELLHRAESEEGLAPDALCAWLRQRINDFANSPDEDQLRLESDDDAVLLATVHKSKGLEYPIVFCPFLWKAVDPKNRGGILFHDPANGYRLTLDLQDKRPEPDDNKNMAHTECVAESLRALYVALTRAQNRCYVYAGDISGFEWSPLARVFGSASPFRALQALAKNAGGSVTVTVVDPAEDQKVKVQASETELTALSARSFSGAIPRARMIASFTSLVSGALEEERDRNVVELGQPSLETEATINDLSRFEGSIRAGVFLHDVLEHLDFQAPNQIDQLVGLKLATHGIAGSDWREPFCAQLRLLLATPLQPGLTLSQIPLAQRLSEVEFSFPIVSLQPDQLRKFFLKHGGPPLPGEFPDSLGRLCFQPVEGFMRGFIDLLFRFGERYYIVDWKSNWLGNRPGDYDEQAIRACMTQHSYFLQYHLYTIAADLYLSSRIAGYEYDKQFGGVFYVFFRGLDPENPNRGIFRDRPNAFLVRALRQNLIDGLL